MFELPGGYSRYLHIVLFMLFMLIPLSVIEFLFYITGSDLSLLDGADAGQISLYVASALMVIIYSAVIAGDRPIQYLVLYAQNWRRSTKGFLHFLCFALVVSLLGYLVFFSFGQLEWKSEVMNSVSQDKWVKFVTYIPVVSILAMTEESIFRGFLFRYLRFKPNVLTTVLAMAFASFVFAFVHKLEDPLDWFTHSGVLLFIGLFLLGCCLCTLYAMTHSILCCAGLHAGFLVTENFRFYTDGVILGNDHWWSPMDQDIRTSPVAWTLFLLVLLAALASRKWLHRNYAVEKQVISNTDLSEPYTADR